MFVAMTDFFIKLQHDLQNILIPRCMVKKELLELFAQNGFVTEKNPYIAALNLKYLFTLEAKPKANWFR